MVVSPNTLTVTMVVVALGVALAVYGLVGLLRYLIRRRTRRILDRMMRELFVFNKQDACWDPIGSIDVIGMDVLIAVLSHGGSPAGKLLSRKEFNEIKEKWSLRT